MVLVADLVWDLATLALTATALFYIQRIDKMFRGGTYGKAYTYYHSAVLVLALLFTIKVVLDLAGINPISFDISVRDIAVMTVVMLFLLGFRESARFWSLSGSKGTGSSSLKPQTQ